MDEPEAVEPETTSTSYDIVRVVDAETGEPLTGNMRVRSDEPYETEESWFGDRKIRVERNPEPTAETPEPEPVEAAPIPEPEPERVGARVLTSVTFTPSALLVRSVLNGPLRGVHFMVTTDGKPSVGTFVGDSSMLAMIAEMCLGVMDPNVAGPPVIAAYEALRNARTSTSDG